MFFFLLLLIPLPDVLYLIIIFVIHCGVVGNIQAFHVCAPGSIPGDGVFLSFFFSFFDTFISPFFSLFMDTDHSSVGRAEDCSW